MILNFEFHRTYVSSKTSLWIVAYLNRLSLPGFHHFMCFTILCGIFSMTFSMSQVIGAEMKDFQACLQTFICLKSYFQENCLHLRSERLRYLRQSFSTGVLLRNVQSSMVKCIILYRCIKLMSGSHRPMSML